jgi:hypothetical protein
MNLKVYTKILDICISDSERNFIDTHLCTTVIPAQTLIFYNTLCP